MRSRNRVFRVCMGGRDLRVTARTAGGAVRKAVRVLIREGRIRRQPKNDDSGGWKGVNISVVGG